MNVISRICLLFLSVSVAELARGDDEHFNGADDFIRAALKHWEAPGVAIAVVKDGERSSILVGCAGDVAEACRWLLPGDAALIAGTAKGPVRRAAHVGLLLSRIAGATPIGPVVEPPYRPFLLLRFKETITLDGLTIRFEDNDRGR